MKSSSKAHEPQEATVRYGASARGAHKPEPFGVLYERHFASVLAFFRRRTAGPEEAFDLAAETFAAADLTVAVARVKRT